MKYKALRPCRFAGRLYLIGEIIADGVVHNSATTRLIKGGVIEAVDGEGATPPLATTLVEEEKPDEEPIEEETVEEEVVVEEANDTLEFTVDNLAGLKKSELLELADSYGMDVKKLKAKNKNEIAEAVLEVVKDDI